MERGQLSLSCTCTPVEDAEYDPDGDLSPAGAVVMAIAAVSDSDPTDLRPLHETIDADALNRLFDGSTRASSGTGRILCFSVDGWNVFVRNDGRIRVCDPTGSDDPSPVFD